MDETLKELPVYDDLNREEFTTCEIATPETESTTEPVRNLASVRRIAAIDPIEGADRIVCATVDGWKLVTQKSNDFSPGDFVVYFEIDSFLPVEDRFEFLRPSSFKSTKHLGDGFRIKTIKLKGQVSQGLILPMTEFFHFDTIDRNWYFKGGEDVDYAYEGMDLTALLGVKKWEKPLDPRLGGVARGNFPSFIRKTDQERVQNYFGKLKGHRSVYNPDTGEVTYSDEHNFDQNERWEATLKLDGSSMTVYLHGADGEEKTFGVCSRNLDLKETADNTFWQVARKLELEDDLRAIGRNLALQGELMGPGVQGNREGLKDHEFFLFDIFDIDAQCYLSPGERIVVLSELRNVQPAPVIASVSLKQFETVDDFLKYADRKSLNHAIAEGVVFKAFDQNHPHRQINSFKVINNRFLLNEKDD